MVDALISFLREESILMLTGIFVTFISGLLYTTNAQGFIHRGKYRKKEDAIIIFLGSTIILGVLTPFIYRLSVLTIDYVPVVTIVGILIFGANFVLHYSIPTWKQTSTKSLLIYLLAIFLIILGILISIYW